jgi:SAM-dependent methyltransferase
MILARKYVRIARQDFVNLLCESNIGFRCYLKLVYGARIPEEKPIDKLCNRSLKDCREWHEAVTRIRQLGLVPHRDLPKNWDALEALSIILAETNPRAFVLDAGAELYSPLLPSLFLYGYRNLIGMNIGFDRIIRRGPIHYEPGDLTKTEYTSGTFDAIACLSVIEHGVDLSSYFKEMWRILKPGGVLVTSTDYWPEPIDTSGAIAYGTPVKIFTEREIASMLELSRDCGFEPTGPIDLTARQRAIAWKPLGLEFTFIVFCLRKRN